MFGFGAAALLMTNEGEQMFGVEMIGQRLQNLQAEPLGLGQLALLMTSHSAGERLGEVEHL